MPQQITRVKWTASNVPSGLSFDAEGGEYTVPVTVETNYGTATKDVMIEVEGKAYPVYAIGSRAKTWSNNSEPDGYGFRKLDMPEAYMLKNLFWGFQARTAGGEFYCVGAYDTDTSDDTKTYKMASTPRKLNNVFQIQTGILQEVIGAYSFASCNFMLTRYVDGKLRFKTKIRNADN